MRGKRTRGREREKARTGARAKRRAVTRAEGKASSSRRPLATGLPGRLGLGTGKGKGQRLGREPGQMGQRTATAAAAQTVGQGSEGLAPRMAGPERSRRGYGPAEARLTNLHHSPSNKEQRAVSQKEATRQ